MASAKTRQTAVAGSWYPADPEVLMREVDQYLAAADPVAGTPVALIAPHAGLKYSGPVAAYAYTLLLGCVIDVAVVVGRSHYVAFDGVSLYEGEAFETPLGPVPIDQQCSAAVAKGCRRVNVHAAAHVREHSLEMQLPFLKHVLPDISIVPLVMGDQRRDTAFELGAAIAAAVQNRRAVVIASTDLSHYHDAATAAKLDATVIREVRRFDADGLMSALETFPGHACGGGPAVAVMQAASALGATDARILKYGDSGDVSGDKDAVVGYLAAAFGAFGPEEV